MPASVTKYKAGFNAVYLFIEKILIIYTGLHRIAIRIDKLKFSTILKTSLLFG